MTATARMTFGAPAAPPDDMPPFAVPTRRQTTTSRLRTTVRITTGPLVATCQIPTRAALETS